MPTKPNPADIAFSKCVRERADWQCQYSGVMFERNAHGLHCSHFYGRRMRSLRWHPLNCFAHSYASHNFLGENPHEFTEWAEKELGTDKYLELVGLSQIIMPTTKLDRKEIAKHYREEHKRMLSERDAGAVGWLDFEIAPLIAERLEK